MSDDLVTIEKYQFLPQAEVARIAIQAEGIDSFLADAEAVNMDWGLRNAIGYIKLQVRQSQAEAAQAILERMRARRDARDVDLDPADPSQCLACGAAIQDDKSECSQCGWSYVSDDAELDPGTDDSEDSESNNREPATADERQDGESVMDRLVALKRPMIIMLLIPIGGVFVGGLLFFLIWVCQLIAR